jgi:hypothetical protein
MEKSAVVLIKESKHVMSIDMVLGKNQCCCMHARRVQGEHTLTRLSLLGLQTRQR